MVADNAVFILVIGEQAIIAAHPGGATGISVTIKIKQCPAFFSRDQADPGIAIEINQDRLAATAAINTAAAAIAATAFTAAPVIARSLPPRVLSQPCHHRGCGHCYALVMSPLSPLSSPLYRIVVIAAAAAAIIGRVFAQVGRVGEWCAAAVLAGLATALAAIPAVIAVAAVVITILFAVLLTSTRLLLLLVKNKDEYH